MFTPWTMTRDTISKQSVSKVLHRNTSQDFNYTSPRNVSWKYVNDDDAKSKLHNNENDVYKSNRSINEMNSVDKPKPYTLKHWKYKRLNRAKQINRLNMGDHRELKRDRSENKTDSWRKLLLNKIKDQHKDFQLWKTGDNVENNRELFNKRENYEARCRKNFSLAKAGLSNKNAETYKPIWKGKFELSDKHKRTCNFCQTKQNLPCEKVQHVKEYPNSSLENKFENRAEGRRTYYFSYGKHYTMEKNNERSTANPRDGCAGRNNLNNKYNPFPFHEYNMASHKSGDDVQGVIKKSPEENLTPIHALNVFKDANNTEKSTGNTHDNELSANKTDEKKNKYELPNNKLDEHAKRKIVISWNRKYHSSNEQNKKFNKEEITNIYKGQKNFGTGIDDIRSRHSSWIGRMKNWMQSRSGFKTNISSDVINNESCVIDDTNDVTDDTNDVTDEDSTVTDEDSTVTDEDSTVTDEDSTVTNDDSDVTEDESYVTHVQRPDTIISNTRDQVHKNTSESDLLPRFHVSFPEENFNKQREKSGKKKYKITIKKKPKSTDKHACHCEVNAKSRRHVKTSTLGHMKRGEYQRNPAEGENVLQPRTMQTKPHHQTGVIPTETKSRRHVKFQKPVSIGSHLQGHNTLTPSHWKRGQCQRNPAEDENVLQPRTMQTNPHHQKGVIPTETKSRRHVKIQRPVSIGSYLQGHNTLTPGHWKRGQYQRNPAEGENILQPRTMQTKSHHQKGVISQPHNYRPRSAENEQKKPNCQVRLKVSTSAQSVKRVRFEESLNTCLFYNVLSEHEHSSDTASFDYKTFLNNLSFSNENSVDANQSSLESQDEEQFKQALKHVFKPDENIPFKPTANESTNDSNLHLTCNNGKKGSQPSTHKNSFTEHRINHILPDVTADNHFSNIRLEDTANSSFGYPPRYYDVNEEDRTTYKKPVNDSADQWQKEIKPLPKPFQANNANKTQTEEKCAGAKIISPLTAGTGFNYPSKRQSYAVLPDTVQCRRTTPPSRGQSMKLSEMFHNHAMCPPHHESQLRRRRRRVVASPVDHTRESTQMPACILPPPTTSPGVLHPLYPPILPPPTYNCCTRCPKPIWNPHNNDVCCSQCPRPNWNPRNNNAVEIALAPIFYSVLDKVKYGLSYVLKSNVLNEGKYALSDGLKRKTALQMNRHIRPDTRQMKEDVPFCNDDKIPQTNLESLQQ